MSPRPLLPLLALAAAAAAGADEGMWLPSQLPELAPRLAARGLEGDPRALADLAGAPLGAIVSLGGCSAAFVSPDGLIATNHHCVVGALQVSSSPERNLLRDGFIARTRADEPWAGPGSRAYVTLSVTDVTGEIAGDVDDRLDDLARGKLLERRVKARTAACERRGVRCTVAPFWEGARWLELAQRELEDVRLVFAPPGAVGNFGGEIDNWTWPRHSGDFALLRAYARPDGTPGPFAKENVPYRPARWLPIASGGAKEGELVMAAGYPGKTHRLRTAAEVRDLVEWAYPRTVRRNAELLAILENLSKASRETELRVAPRVRALANALKNRRATVENAARTGLVARRAAAERELAAWIASDATRRAAYGGALERLDELEAARERTRERDAAFAALGESSSLLSAARTLRRLAQERPKKDLDRLPEFQARNAARLREGLVRLAKTLDPAADRALLRHAVLEAAALPDGQRLPPLDAATGLAPGLPADEAARRVDAWLDGLYAGTRLGDAQVRLGLFDASPKVAARAQDPFLALDAQLQPFEETLRAEEYARAGARSRAAPRYARALIERAGGLLAPDANGTLRVTYGAVAGAEPRDGLAYRARTTLAGVLEKDRPGDRDFDVPRPLRDAIRAELARPAGPWRDPGLGAVPVDFLATLDATGGNSGSAVVNARGELVGLLFDTMYEALGSDLRYDPSRGRSIQVDVRYLLWFLSEVSGATSLLDELGVGAATPARSPSPR